MKSVYLSGPVSGQSFSEANKWRELVAEMVHSDIKCINPLRDKPDFSIIKESRTAEELLEDIQHGIRTVTRNRMDIMECDLLLANVLINDAFSLGTIGEIFWADAYRKPIILIKNDNSIYNHAMLDAICQWQFITLEAAINQINILLSDLNR